jgi:hypothetical protein
MIQSIIAILIVAVAAFLVLKSFFKKPAPKESSDCGGCASSCGGCPVASLKTDTSNKSAH